MTFVQPFDNISHCQDYITINDRKTFTIYLHIVKIHGRAIRGQLVVIATPKKLLVAYMYIFI